MITRQFDGPAPRTKLPAGAVDTQMHAYLPGYPAEPGFIALPENAPGPDEYRLVMARLGLERVVVTQGNAHGFNNDNVLACLAAFGPVARGVAVITGETGNAEMQRLSDAGVVGARIMDLLGGAVGLSRLAEVDRRAQDYDWSIAVQFDGSHILEHEEKLAAIESRWILDHHGKFFSGIAADGPEVDAVKRLIDGGRCWFKFAACYESSKTGGPDFADIARVAEVVGRYAPERIVWGTNWPHNLMKRTEDYPDDAALLDTVLSWLPDDRARQLCLVDSPNALFFRDR